MCSYAIIASSWAPDGQRETHVRGFHSVWAGSVSVRPSQWSDVLLFPFFSLFLSLLRQLSLPEQPESSRRSVRMRIRRMMMMDAIPCRLVFLALFFGARIQHTEGKHNALSSALCYVRADFCNECCGSGGHQRVALCLQATAAPKRECFCKDGAGQREKERKRKRCCQEKLFYSFATEKKRRETQKSASYHHTWLRLRTECIHLCLDGSRVINAGEGLVWVWLQVDCVYQIFKIIECEKHTHTLSCLEALYFQSKFRSL